MKTAARSVNVTKPFGELTGWLQWLTGWSQLKYGTLMGSLIDKFGRHVSYLRLSVTDRCDLRCTYCMAERMVFLPRSELLTLEELSKLSHHFIDKGIRKIRITGGEPLLRRDIISLFEDISPRLKSDLSELTLTTNATQLSKLSLIHISEPTRPY